MGEEIEVEDKSNKIDNIRAIIGVRRNFKMRNDE